MFFSLQRPIRKDIGTAHDTVSTSSPEAQALYDQGLAYAGRVDEALKHAAADRFETEYLRKENIPPEHNWHYHHNLDLLATSYQYLGQMAKAERLLKQSFAIPSHLAVQEFNKREWPVFLLASGRAEEALQAAQVMIGHVSPLIRASGHIQAGEAMLATRRFQLAAEEANTALRELKSASDGAALVATSLEQL